MSSSSVVRSGQSEGTIEVTPSGIPVYYQSKPKRLYRIGKPTSLSADSPALLGAAQAPDTDWREVPSVTTVLGVLDKPALPWWGMKVGAEGVTKLHSLGLLKITVLPGGHQAVLACPTINKRKGAKGQQVRELDWDKWIVAGVEQLTDLLTMYKLTVNHVRDQAGDRGQSVHDAFELWAESGYVPDPAMFPPTERGYVEGLVAFLADVPSAEPEGSEVLVASSEYGFAGRYDLRLRTSVEHEVVVHRTPVNGAQRRLLPPARLLVDLKTSKGVYASHAKQLEAYEQASIESGYEPTDARGILHVSAEGEYEFVRSWGTFEDFRVVLDVYRSDERMRDEAKQA